MRTMRPAAPPECELQREERRTHEQIRQQLRKQSDVVADLLRCMHSHQT